MFRRALVLLCLLARPAFGTDAGDRVEMWSGGSRGFGLSADFSRSIAQTGIGRHVQETSMVGVAWRQGGLKIAATAGVLGYDLTGGGGGQSRIASFSVGHEIVQARGGTRSLELRHSKVWGPETSLDIASARLGWSLKF
jgi:hypothetical protein